MTLDPIITEKQAEFLGNVRILMARNNGIPPSLDEMGEINGFSGETSRWYVRCLIRKGYLTRTPGKVRSLQLTVAAIEILDRMKARAA